MQSANNLLTTSSVFQNLNIVSDTKESSAPCGLIVTSAVSEPLNQYIVGKTSSPTAFVVVDNKLFYVDNLASVCDEIKISSKRLADINAMINKNNSSVTSSTSIDSLTQDELQFISYITGYIRVTDIYRQMRSLIENLTIQIADRMFQSIQFAHSDNTEMVSRIKSNVNLKKKNRELESANSTSFIKINDSIFGVLLKEKGKQISRGIFGIVKYANVHTLLSNDHVERFTQKAVKKTGKYYTSANNNFITKFHVNNEIVKIKKELERNIKVSLSEAIFREYLKQINNPALQRILIPSFGSAVSENKRGGISVYQFMEIANLGDLNGFIQDIKNRQVNIPSAFLAKITLMLLDIIRILHSENIFHRDLKPKNILLHRNENNEMEMLVTDFGSAVRYVHNAKVEVSRISAAHIVPPEFTMTPHQDIEVEKQLSKKQDAWETGLMLLDLWSASYRCTDQLDEDFSNKFESLANITEKNAIVKNLIINYLYACPDHIQDMIISLLHPDPHQRLTVDQAYTNHVSTLQPNKISYTDLERMMNEKCQKVFLSASEISALKVKLITKLQRFYEPEMQNANQQNTNKKVVLAQGNPGEEEGVYQDRIGNH